MTHRIGELVGENLKLEIGRGNTETLRALRDTEEMHAKARSGKGLWDTIIKQNRRGKINVKYFLLFVWMEL